MLQQQIKLSSDFKLQASQAILSVILFIIVYLGIIFLTLALAAACVYGGVLLIITIPRLLTMLIGAGIASTGIIVFFFLIKFIFKTNKADRTGLLEISRAQQPELFRLIDDITAEVGTSSPKRVYISNEVNASVFYDSSFWSMFLPVRKNLVIGLGLVNTVSKDELKAILSHEFGHFSQSTMKVGSYVYHVNQVIFNMLYDNDSYGQAIGKWAGLSSILAFFTLIAIQIIQGIQWILKKMYEYINKSYMALSREMEFHADEIAANLTGYQPLKTSLLRMTLAEHAYQSVLSHYHQKQAEGIKSNNIYQEQFFVMNFLAKETQIPIINNLPEITLEDTNKYNKSKLIIKDQWASHPSLEERIARLETTGIQYRNTLPGLANELFRGIEALQKALTEQVFQYPESIQNNSIFSLEDFEEAYQKDIELNSLPKSYNGYYDNKNPVLNDLDNIVPSITPIPEELFSEDIVDTLYIIQAMENDSQVLRQIADGALQIKTFDYDGLRYNQNQADSLSEQIAADLVQLKKRIKTNDILIYQAALYNEQTLSLSNKLKDQYQAFYQYDQYFEERIRLYNELQENLQFLLQVTPYEEIENNFNNILEKESQLKEYIRGILKDPDFQTEINDEIRDIFTTYVAKSLVYFSYQTYHEDNLQVLFKALHNYADLLTSVYFLKKKALLEYQADLLSLKV